VPRIFALSGSPICQSGQRTKHKITGQMTNPRKSTRKTPTRLKRCKLVNLLGHGNGVSWVRAKVNGNSRAGSLQVRAQTMATKRMRKTTAGSWIKNPHRKPEREKS
jgi:hypothetical protein